MKILRIAIACIMCWFLSQGSHAGSFFSSLRETRYKRLTINEDLKTNEPAIKVRSREVMITVEAMEKNSIVPVVSYTCGRKRRLFLEQELQVVAELLEGGALVDERDPKNGRTPLMYAVGNIDMPLIKLLLEHGANPRATNKTQNVESYARDNLNIFVELAKAAKSIPMFVSHAYIYERRNLSVLEVGFVEELLKSGSLVDERDSRYGSTPLMFAVQKGDLPLVRLLLRYGADPRAKNGSQTVESYAQRRVCIFKELAKAAQSIVMLVAYVNGHEMRKLKPEERLVVEELLQRGVPVDERDSKWGSTSLMFAVQQRDMELIRLLVRAGADPHAINAGKNVAQFANNNRKILKLLGLR